MFLKYFLTSKTVRSAVLLVGLCDSGKTLLFTRVSSCSLESSGTNADADLKRCVQCPQLLSGKFKRTQTSITDNSAPYKVKSDRVGVFPLLIFLVTWWFTLPPVSRATPGP